MKVVTVSIWVPEVCRNGVLKSYIPALFGVFRVFDVFATVLKSVSEESK